MSHVITAARLIDRVGHLGAKHNMVSLEDSDDYSIDFKGGHLNHFLYTVRVCAITRVAVMSNLCIPSASCL